MSDVLRSRNEKRLRQVSSEFATAVSLTVQVSSIISRLLIFGSHEKSPVRHEMYSLVREVCHSQLVLKTL